MTDTFLKESLAILGRTRAVFDALLRDSPEGWTEATEGEGTGSPYAVIGHLIHGEVADWMPRLEMILEHGPSRTFPPFDREAQFAESEKKPLGGTARRVWGFAAGWVAAANGFGFAAGAVGVDRDGSGVWGGDGEGGFGDVDGPRFSAFGAD